MIWGCSFFIPESPRWQKSKLQYDQAKETLALVAKVNGKKDFNINELFLEGEEDENGLMYFEKF